MTREEAINLLDNLIGMVEDSHNSDYDMALQMAIKALKQESFKKAYIQVAKERDIAIEQLNELGYSWGEKIEPCNKVRAEIEAQEKCVGKAREDMKDKIKQIAEHYGYDSQSHMLIEEMAELTQAINKYYRVRNEHGYPTDKTSGEVFSNLLEEIADVEICIEELKALLDCNAKVSAWKYTKIARQLERMEKETS